MKLHRNAKTTPISRLALVRRVQFDGWSYQAVAEGYGVSVRTVAKWRRRFREQGAAGLEDGSSRPQQTPHITPAICVTVIRQLREQHGLPAWAIGRMVKKEYRIEDYELAPGSICIMSPYVMHRHPRYHPDPERFDPQRFTPEARLSRPKFAYFPFGGGPRVCIGERFAWMEGTLLLASIVQALFVNLFK